MKYFLHDTSAFEDDKITELFMKFGYEGLGLFYTILEKLAKQEKPIKTAVLKKQLHVGKKLEKCWAFMESLEIISSNNHETFNKRLVNFSKKYEFSKEKVKNRVSKFRANQSNRENVTRYETVTEKSVTEVKRQSNADNSIVYKEDSINSESLSKSNQSLSAVVSPKKMEKEEFENFSKKLLSDQLFCETLQITYRDIKPEHIPKWVSKFNLSIIGNEKINKDFLEYKRHFTNWIGKQDTSAPPKMINGNSHHTENKNIHDVLKRMGNV